MRLTRIVLAVLVGVAFIAALATTASAAPTFVNVTAPADGSTLGGSFDVVAETDTTGTATLLIDDSVVATTSAFGGAVPTYTVMFPVASAGLSNADHSIKVAVDSSGSTTSAPVTITVVNPHITNLTPSLGTISPDKDRINDYTTITYDLDVDATVTAIVKNSLDTTVDTLFSNVATTAGSKVFIWKGYKSFRPDLKNGTYSIRVTATQAAGGSDTEMVAVKILCGKSKPIVTPMFSSFSPLDRDGVRDRVKIYVNLPKYSYLMVCVYSSSGRLVKVLSPYVLRPPGRYQWYWNGRSRTGAMMPAGLYVIKAWTRNQAGGWYSIGRVRIKGIRTLLLVRNLLRLWWLEGKDPLPGPTWADWRYNGEKVAVFPLAMGMPGWSTPLGHTYVEAKRVWPTWYPPSWAGMSGPVGPGKSNPLGPRAMNLAPGGYDTGIRIHGTNNPSSIGTYASHGCIRMYPKDVIWLFDRVPLGTKVWVSRTLPSGYPLVGPNRPSWGVTRRWY